MAIDLRDRTTQVTLAAAGTGLLAGAVLLKRWRRSNRRLRTGPLTPDTLPGDVYDAVIVGAGRCRTRLQGSRPCQAPHPRSLHDRRLPHPPGPSKWPILDAHPPFPPPTGPSGSVCAYFMASGGARVALLDKARFPREKVCGDAVCTPALEILAEMGVLKELVAEGRAKFADAGGFVSPAGLSYIGNSVHRVGRAVACAIKRIHLDDKVAKAAAAAGADLREGFEAGGDVSFDAAAGLWTVRSVDGAAVRGRVLVAADGSTSALATHLGLCVAPPLGVSSRAYIQRHNTDFDGACFYPRHSLPGYAAIFRHADGDLGYCYYLIPSGPGRDQGQMGRVSAADLVRLHEEGISKDPFISRAMGPAPVCGRMRAAALRVGAQGVPRSFGDHLLILGDAAGHIDPLTGEGIHTAMMSGKIAAQTLLEARAAGDFTAANTALYEARWRARYGADFFWSYLFAEAIYRCPILLDAVANEVQRTGDAMMSTWAEVATCMRPKTHLLRPDIAARLGAALVREAWAQWVAGRPDAYVMLPPPENGAA